MNKYEKFTQLVKNIYLISDDENFGEKFFTLLKEVLNFQSGYIFFTNPERLEYSFNKEASTISQIQKPYIKEDLFFKDSIYGSIIITGENFSTTDKKLFEAVAAIVSNIVKDIELTKVIKMQIEALQSGFNAVKKDSDKRKKTEEVKNKFLSHVTHELRTPLNSILGFSDLLGSEFAGKLNNKQLEYVNDIKVAGINLLGLVNEILDMSKIEANSMQLNLTKFPIALAINEVSNIISPLILKKDLKFTKKVGDIEIEADYQKFQQILFNLLGNAVKYTPQGGTIDISAVKNKKNIIVAVKDSGVGIDKKFQKKIFLPFQQANATSSNSTGLGLAITDKLVKLHKWEISVNSELENGAEFVITIPIKY